MAGVVSLEAHFFFSRLTNYLQGADAGQLPASGACILNPGPTTPARNLCSTDAVRVLLGRELFWKCTAAGCNRRASSQIMTWLSAARAGTLALCVACVKLTKGAALPGA